MADAKSDKGAKGVRGNKNAAPKSGGSKSDASKAPVSEKKVKGRQAPTESALAGEVPAAPKDYVARLQKMYHEVIAPGLMKAISTFKVRENMPIGAKVTLRKTRMYEFLDRLVTVALPRVRDFRGLDPKSFDGRGNYALGVQEHIIFPEIDYDKAESNLGMDIVVCTTARTDAEAQALLRAFNFPFRQ
jgi:hypothetical protein